MDQTRITVKTNDVSQCKGRPIMWDFPCDILWLYIVLVADRAGRVSGLGYFILRQVVIYEQGSYGCFLTVFP